MKKRWIPFIALASIVIFAGGIMFGSATEADQQTEFWDTRRNIHSTIAVVNSDMGVVDADGERRNYSAAIIQALENEFTQASPALAETGFLDGTFAAVITFPSHVSSRVMSFEEGATERVRLEFMINPNKLEKEYIETFLRILNLQQAINTAMAKEGVGSAFEQFHAAQNQVADIFQNNEDSLVAMNIIELEQFTPPLNLDEIPETSFEPEAFDGASHLSSVEGFASTVANLYLNTYSQASSSFLNMRERLFPIADEIPVIAEGWLENLEEWSKEWEEYGETLRNYEVLSTDLVLKVNLFRVALTNYLEEVDEFTGDADEYFTLLNNWYNSLNNNFNNQVQFYSDLRDEIGRINASSVTPKNERIRILMGWYDNYLDAGHKRLESWLDSPTWLALQESRLNSLQSQVGMVGNRPDRSVFAPGEDGDIAYQAAVSAWHAIAIANFADTTNLVNILAEDLEKTLLNIFNFTIPVFEDHQPINDAATDLCASESLGTSWNVERVSLEDVYINSFEEDVPEPLEPFMYEIPEEDTPESAEAFLELLRDLRGQLADFDMEAYITSDLLQDVDEQLTAFSTYLDFVREGLDLHVEGDNMQLSMIYFEYMSYLIGLRQEVFEAEIYELANLHSRLEEFYDVHNAIRVDTRAKLTDFASAMPESRTEAGINRELIERTISPFEFTSPALRGDVGPDVFEGESLYDRFGGLLWIVIPLLLLVFFVTLASHLVLRKKEKEN